MQSVVAAPNERNIGAASIYLFNVYEDNCRGSNAVSTSYSMSPFRMDVYDIGCWLLAAPLSLLHMHLFVYIVH
jgi:hypothetical protein